jgi:type I restriction enzyme R subunit
LLRGEFKKSQDTVLDSREAHQNQMMQPLSDPEKAEEFDKIVFDLLKLAE